MRYYLSLKPQVSDKEPLDWNSLSNQSVDIFIWPLQTLLVTTRFLVFLVKLSLIHPYCRERSLLLRRAMPLPQTASSPNSTLMSLFKKKKRKWTVPVGAHTAWQYTNTWGLDTYLNLYQNLCISCVNSSSIRETLHFEWNRIFGSFECDASATMIVFNDSAA